MARLFGTDGVRGIAGVHLTPQLAMNIGIGTASVLTKDKENVKIIIGNDGRESADMIVSAIISGLTSVGVDVIDVGLVPTPAISYLVKHYNLDAGIMVTASHNSYEYNGIKIFDSNGYKLAECKDFSIVCTAPSKTFNLAGMQTSNIIIPNEEMRTKFKAECDAVSVGGVSPMGMAACEAAYTGGAEWLDQLRLYLQENRDYMKGFLAEHFPEFVMSDLEGTYLVWVDMRALGLTNDELKKYMLEKCKLWLDDGDMFGVEGEGFMRFNIACTRATLEKAMYQMKDAFDELKK